MNKYGYKRDLPDFRDYQLKVKRRFWFLPKTVDLRTSNNLPAVYDQGQLGSCTANAVSAAFDFDRKKQGEQWIGPSRLFVYYNERMDDGDVSTDGGSTIRESVKAVKNYGVCPEVSWPYDEKKFKIKPSANLYAAAQKNEALAYARVARGDIRKCLAGGQPVVIGISVYNSFEGNGPAKNGIIPMPSKNESVIGGHAVLVVGYKPGYYIVRNSWGSGWGDAGYFYLPSAYLDKAGLASDFWALTSVN